MSLTECFSGRAIVHGEGTAVIPSAGNNPLPLGTLDKSLSRKPTHDDSLEHALLCTVIPSVQLLNPNKTLTVSLQGQMSYSSLTLRTPPCLLYISLDKHFINYNFNILGQEYILSNQY